MHIKPLNTEFLLNYAGRIFNLLTRSTALRFTAARVSLAARRIRILPMTFGMKKNFYLCSQFTGDVENVGLRVSDMDSVNSGSDYFAYLCTPASEITIHQKRISTADRSHLRR
jgi:hypothetical protein